MENRDRGKSLIKWLSTVFTSLCLTTAFAGLAYAADAQEVSDEKSLSTTKHMVSTKAGGDIDETAKSLRELIRRAEEQGLIEIRREDGAEQNTPDIADLQSSGYGELAATKACEGMEVFDFTDLAAVKSYDDLIKIEASPGDLETPEAGLELARHYLALGLGIEAIALAEKYLKLDAQSGVMASLAFVPVIGRVVEGIATDEDINALAYRLPCKNYVDLWYIKALIPRPVLLEQAPKLEVTDDMLARAKHMPPQLAKSIYVRLGQYASEIGDHHQAAEILTDIAPGAVRNKLEAGLSTDVQFLYALTHYVKGDPAALEILEREAQLDGVYKSRALRLLAEIYDAQDLKPYPGFDLDMRVISHFHAKGPADMLFAEVNIVKAAARRGHMKEAIALSQENLPLDSPELQAAVEYISDSLTQSLSAAKAQPRLKALDIYVSEEEFFETYSRLAELKAAAIKAAIDLGMPELVIQLENVETLEGVELAQVKILLKKQDYAGVEAQAKLYPESPDFQALRIEAAVKAGRFEQAAQLISNLGDELESLEQLSDLSWQRGQWKDAALNLETLNSRLVDENPKLRKRAELAEFLSAPPAGYMSRSGQNLNGLETMSSQTDDEMKLIRGYLNNG